MSKIRSSLFALVVAASATVAATAGAQSTAPADGQRVERSKSDSTHWKHRGAKGHGREAMGPGRSALRGVKPTDAQKAQIEAIHEKYQPQFTSTREQAQALRAQETAEIRAILTPEQQKTFDANVAQMKARGDHAKKGRGNRHAG